MHGGHDTTFEELALAIGRKHVDEAAKRMLLDAGVLLALDVDAGTRLMMPMRMSPKTPAGVAAKWPSSKPNAGETQLSVRFELAGARLPPGVIERCVGSVSTLKGCRLLECWRHGALLIDASPGKPEDATALLELTSSELKIEVRGSANLDAEVLKRFLDLLVGAVDHVLAEYPGFMCERKNE